MREVCISVAGLAHDWPLSTEVLANEEFDSDVDPCKLSAWVHFNKPAKSRETPNQGTFNKTIKFQNIILVALLGACQQT